MGSRDKPLVWLHGEIKTLPMGSQARLLAGFLLRSLQRGERLGMPESRPMPAIGARCHELRIPEGDVIWRIFYRTDADAVVLLDIVKEKTRTTPPTVLEACRRRLADYDRLTQGDRT